jgi:hypothetical protein|tara:strand:- start:696 stop:1214 length:519 start_codon:yes stop_codon:yes gene_type:complete
MYFEKFPRIQYTNTANGNPVTVTNILKRISARQALKENSTILEKYLIRGSETPESLAFDLYGDAELHWVILLVNEIYDRYHQWPMNVNQFQAYLASKYDNPDGVHHYEIAQSSGDTNVTINIGSDNSDYPSATLVTNFEFEEKLQDERRAISILAGNFISQFVKEYESLQSN